MQQVLQQTRGMPPPPPEGSPEAELLPKDKILEIVKIQIDQQVETVTAMMAQVGAANEQEK